MLEKIKEYKIFFYFAPILLLAMILIGKFSLLGFAGIIGLVILGIIFIFILKEPFWGLLLLIFTLPFERIPTIDIGLFTLKIDQVFAGLTLVSWVLKALFEQRKLLPYPIFWPLILFMGISFASTLYAVDFSRAVTVFIFVLFMSFISLLTVNLITDKEKLAKVIKVLFISAFVVCLFGFYQFMGDVAGLPIALTGLKDIYTKAVLGFPRIQAFSMEPLFLANFLFIPLGLALSLYLFKQKKIIPPGWLLTLVLFILITIVLGISRGAYIALGVLALFFAVFLLKRFVTFKNMAIIILAVCVIGGAAYGFLSISRPDAVSQFIEHATVQDYSQGESVQKRLQDYQKALDFWQESPWIGIGPGNYGPRYYDYPSHDQVTGWEAVNNQYLETLAETGILGLLLLALIYVVVIWRSIAAYFKTNDLFLKSVLFGLLAAFIAILVQYNFFSTLYIMHIWFLIGLLLAVQNLCLADSRGSKFG